MVARGGGEDCLSLNRTHQISAMQPMNERQLGATQPVLNEVGREAHQSSLEQETYRLLAACGGDISKLRNVQQQS